MLANVWLMYGVLGLTLCSPLQENR